MITKATAPAKAILLGEHFVVYGTGAILCAVQKYTSVSVEARSTGVRVSSRYGCDEFASGDDPKNASRHHRPILQIANDLGRGADVTIDSEIPPGVGLGSSSACCVAGAGAMLNQNGQDVEDLALRAEKSVFDGVSGADTAACLRGGLIEFGARGARSFEHAGVSLVVALTGREHSTAETVAAVRQNKERDEDAFGAVCEQVGGLIGDARSALDASDLVSLGAHMSQNQKFLTDIGVSDPTIDRIVAAAQRTSYGAKLTGAGAGGCVIALVDDSNAAKTLGSVEDAGATAFRVETDCDGLRIS